MTPFIKYISDLEHYNNVLSLVTTVKQHLWIATADIKDLYVKTGTSTTPFVAILDRLLRHGVSIRLIHAKEPGPAFQNDFDKYPTLIKNLERSLCPRVHFKIIIFDLSTVYIGSANLTGAGIGMKSNNRRNFEAGILTNHPHLVQSTINHFDSVWNGSKCKHCGRKQYCNDQIK